MRVAIISDVHGNVRALEAVLADLRARGPFDRVINGGDLAFGGPRPGETMAALEALAYPTIIGNTDEWVAAAAEGAGGVPEPVQRAAEWTGRQLSADQLESLHRLPMVHRVEPAGGPPLVVVHATPVSTTDAIMPDAPDEVLTRAMEQARTRTLAYGHIHQAYIREVGDGLVVNVGSVGFPFDGDPRPAWAICTLHNGRWHAEILRVAYDREAVARELESGDHPLGATFARRARTGQF